MLRDIIESYEINEAYLSKGITEGWNLERGSGPDMEFIGRGPFENVPDPELPSRDRVTVGGVTGSYDIYVDGEYIGGISYAGKKQLMRQPRAGPWRFWIDKIARGTADTAKDAMSALVLFHPHTKGVTGMKREIQHHKEHGINGSKRAAKIIDGLLGLDT